MSATEPAHTTAGTAQQREDRRGRQPEIDQRCADHRPRHRADTADHQSPRDACRLDRGRVVRGGQRVQGKLRARESRRPTAAARSRPDLPRQEAERERGATADSREPPTSAGVVAPRSMSRDISKSARDTAALNEHSAAYQGIRRGSSRNVRAVSAAQLISTYRLKRFRVSMPHSISVRARGVARSNSSGETYSVSRTAGSLRTTHGQRDRRLGAIRCR